MGTISSTRSLKQGTNFLLTVIKAESIPTDVYWEIYVTGTDMYHSSQANHNTGTDIYDSSQANHNTGTDIYHSSQANHNTGTDIYHSSQANNNTGTDIYHSSQANHNTLLVYITSFA